MHTKFLFFLAGILLISCTSGEKNTTDTKPVKKDIALQLYSFRDEIGKNYDGVIKKVAEMGYTAVEAANYNDRKFYGKSPEEFRKTIEDTGMYVLSSHTGRGLSKEELESKDCSPSLAWWDDCIADHKAAGMKYIVTPSMPVPGTLEDLQTYCNYYNEIGRRCKENGMTFGYHNHDFEFRKIEDKIMYDYMIENTDPDLVKYEMDVYWVVRGGKSPVDYFKKYPGRFEVLHIKDDKELGQSGMVGFDAIFNHTDIAGTKYLVVEVESYNYSPEESIKMSLDYLLNCPLVKGRYD